MTIDLEREAATPPDQWLEVLRRLGVDVAVVRNRDSQGFQWLVALDHDGQVVEATAPDFRGAVLLALARLDRELDPNAPPLQGPHRQQAPQD